MEEHGGNIRALARRAGLRVEEVLDFSASINPLGPPSWLARVIQEHLVEVRHYPEPYAESLVKALAHHHGREANEVVVGNGSTELLFILPGVLPFRRTLIPVPAYVDYARAAEWAGIEVEVLPLREEMGFALGLENLEKRLRSGDLVFLGQPNNPTGQLFDADRFLRLASTSSCLFVVDEAFADFAAGYRSLADRRLDNVLVLRSLTKLYAIPGLRLGYLVARPELATKVRQRIPPWSVNVLSQAVGRAAVEDGEFVRQSREFIGTQRKMLLARLRRIAGLKIFPGVVNYLLARLEQGDAAVLADRLLKQRIAIRPCANFHGLDHRFFRVAVRTEQENERLCQGLEKTLSS